MTSSGAIMTSSPLHRMPGEYDYRGMVLGEFAPREQVDKIRDMEVYDDDVFIASYPKTGTTLTQEMVYLIRHHGDTTSANATHNYLRIPHLENAIPDHTNGLKLCQTLARPRHIKTHLTYETLPKDCGKAKIVIPMRNPKDAILSYFHYYRSTATLGRFQGSWNEFFELFLSNRLCYGNIFDHYLGYWKHRSQSNLLFLKYEDLVRNPRSEIEKIAEFLEVKLSTSEVDSVLQATQFSTMAKNPKTNYTSVPEDIDTKISPFLRKGKIGDWKNYFTVAQADLMDKITESRLRGSGLIFDCE